MIPINTHSSPTINSDSTEATLSTSPKKNTTTFKKQNEITNTIDPSTHHCTPRDPASNTTHRRTDSDTNTAANGATAITAALEFFTTILIFSSFVLVLVAVCAGTCTTYVARSSRSMNDIGGSLPHRHYRWIRNLRRPVVSAVVVCASLLVVGATTAAALPTTTTADAATAHTNATTFPVTTTAAAAASTTPFPTTTGTMRVAWNAKGKVVDAPTTAANNVVGATNVVVWMPTCMTFTDVKTQLAACSTSGAECMITIGADITWSSELTVQGSQLVTMKGVVAGGGRAVLDAKASNSDRRRHLTVAKGGTLSLFNLELKNGYLVSIIRLYLMITCVICMLEYNSD